VRYSDYYTPFERQQEFHSSSATYRLFGGQAGPGKTKALLWEAVIQANTYPKVDTLLLRRTYPELEESLLKEFRRNVPREFYKAYNDQKHIVTWHNGSKTRFGYCRAENDVYQYQGGEYLFIGLDELTFFTLKQWQFLSSRNRCPVLGTVACMAGATNPGNIGHAWVKALWIDKKAPAGYERPDLYKPEEYDFIRARLADNPIYANDEAYKAKLLSLPSNWRKAFMDGDWSVFAGQYFDNFDQARHTERVESIKRESWWPSWISIDWGFEHPSAVYWHTKAPATREHPNGQVITYRELVKNRLSPKKLGEEVAAACGPNEKITDVFLSPDAFAHRTAEASIAEQLGEVFAACGLPRPGPADDDRIGGWMFMYQLLEQDRWVIADNCRALIECLPGLVRDEKRVEDIAKVDGDDPADGARYGLSHMKREIINVPVEVQVAKRMEEGPLVEKRMVDGVETVQVRDMTSYAIQAQKLEAEVRRGQKSFRPGRRR
jgi:phage terminase large subunit